MSGKRILDAAALFNATRAVAYSHFSIRRSQFELYIKTSSLTRGIDRAGRTRNDPSNAAHHLRRSATGTANANSNGSIQTSEPKAAEGERSSTERTEGVEKDHHYERSQENSAAHSFPNGDTEEQQESARNRLSPDDTTLPGDGRLGQAVTRAQGLSSEDAMKLPRQSEAQIPHHIAAPPTVDTFSIPGERFEVGVKQEQDIFHQLPNSTAPVLSALPRFKIPQTEEDVQGGDRHIPQKVNADVFYSSRKPSAGDLAGQRVDEGPPEEMLGSLFHSPRVAKLLGTKSTNTPGGIRPKGSRMYATGRSEFPKGKAALAQARAEGSDGAKKPASETERLERLERLGADLSREAHMEPASSEHKATITTKPPYEMRESRVPSSQLGRLWEFGGLAASMAFEAAGERFSRSGSNSVEQSSFMLSAANVDRLVAKLSKMRGAALKLGQMMSFQDSKLLPKPIHEVLQRVQDSADYMPASQRNAVLAADLGHDWRDLFESFDEKPMAAASIGQVHGAVLRSTKQRVAVKVQYPGVAASISSDLNNLSILLNATRLLPKGLYLDKTIANARTELAWECDYVREAESARRFRELLSDDTDTFTVPAIIDEASGKQALTMEYMAGTAVTKVQTFTQEQKDWIGTQILRLCLREIVEFNYMQTDPNWTNFLYNNETSKLELLDFGASREFPRKFIDLYVKNLAAAARGDRDACRTLSIQLGYLTGYESKAMLNAHVDSVITLAEPFTDSVQDVYDFENQTITDRVRALIPVMIRERLAPPPEETYSLHRKLSGAFLLCARLGSRVRCKEMFQQALARSGTV